jgi:hypothetical protein
MHNELVHLRRVLILTTVVTAFGLRSVPPAQAAQSGPVFPTHRFPTDQSFHLSYRLSYLTTHANYVSARQYSYLTDRFSLIGHSFTGEFQPNRQFSAGAIFNVSSAALNPQAGGPGVSQNKLGDQRVFTEFRFFDRPGRSIGLSFVAKFPGYKNATSAEVTAAGKAARVVLVGDAQLDFSPMLTTEFWFTSTMRTRFDVGYTMRTTQFANEIPAMLSVGYANPRIDLDLRFKAYKTLAGASVTVDGAEDGADVKAAFANSDWAFARNPWALIVQPVVEFWITPSLAATFDANLSLVGNNSAHFREFAIGIAMRRAETRSRKPRTFQEIDIRTEQEEGYFPGEIQGAPPARQRPIAPGADEEF